MADRYIANSGTDSGAGGIGAPWATLGYAKINITNGDNVYLNRGDTWEEQLALSVAQNPTQESERITFDAYGTGAAPIVAPGHDGEFALTAVSAYGADEADRTTITVFVGGLTGSENKFVYFATDDLCGTIKTVLSDTQVTVAGDFSGVTVPQVIRTYSIAGISLSNKSYITIQNLTFQNCTGCPLGSGDAVKFIDNTVTAIKAAGGYMVETTSTSADTLIDGNTLSATPACAAAIGGASASNLTISNNTITDIDGDGIKMLTNTAITIDGNTIGPGRIGQAGSQGHQDGIVVTGSTNCVVSRNTVYNMTQLIYVGANAEQSDTTGLLIWGNVGYITSDYTGGTAPFIQIDVAYNSGASKSTADAQIFWNTCGDLGGAQSAVVLKTTGDGGTGEITSVVARNNCFWTDRAGVGTGWSVGAQVTSIDVDYNNYGQWTAYTTGGNDANALTVNPLFTDYTGYQATAFDFALSGTSTLNNAGDPALTTACTVPASPTDIDGTARTKNSGDIGAYELAGAVATGGPFDVVAGEVYGAGAVKGGTWVAGPARAEVYVPGVVKGEVNS